MLNDRVNYPYPIVRSFLEDYKTTVFTGALSVNLEPEYYLVRPAFQINNSQLEEYLANGMLSYAVEVLSPATWYRKLQLVKDNTPFRIEPTQVHLRVELIPCIVATTLISEFQNEDFEDEYLGRTYVVKPGDVVAIGEARSFDAFFQNDVIKNGSSIVNIGGSKDIKEIECNYTGSIISITMPEEQYNDYLQCGALSAKYKTLNAILVIPAIVGAINKIANDEFYPEKPSELDSKAWYTTIVANLKRLAENSEAKYRKMLECPFESAEALLGNNYIAALHFVNQVQ